MNKTIKMITFNALVAAVYCTMTVINPVAYGILQLRVSLMLYPLAFYLPVLRPAMVLGNMLSNVFSPLGFIDVAFGGIAAAVCMYLCQRIKNPILQTLAFSIQVGAVVATELTICFQADFLFSWLSVGISSGIMYALGMVVMKKIAEVLKKVLPF